MSLLSLPLSLPHVFLSNCPFAQIPLLLSMQEEELALQKAVNSEDTDLMYLTLIHVERTRTDYVRTYIVRCSIFLHQLPQMAVKSARYFHVSHN